MLRALFLFAVLLSGALTVHNTEQVPRLDPDGLQAAAPASDQLPGLDPNGTK